MSVNITALAGSDFEYEIVSVVPPPGYNVEHYKAAEAYDANILIVPRFSLRKVDRQAISSFEKMVPDNLGKITTSKTVNRFNDKVCDHLNPNGSLAAFADQLTEFSVFNIVGVFTFDNRPKTQRFSVYGHDIIISHVGNGFIRIERNLLPALERVGGPGGYIQPPQRFRANSTMVIQNDPRLLWDSLMSVYGRVQIRSTTFADYDEFFRYLLENAREVTRTPTKGYTYTRIADYDGYTYIRFRYYGFIVDDLTSLFPPFWGRWGQWSEHEHGYRGPEYISAYNNWAHEHHTDPWSQPEGFEYFSGYHHTIDPDDRYASEISVAHGDPSIPTFANAVKQLRLLSRDNSEFVSLLENSAKTIPTSVLNSITRKTLENLRYLTINGIAYIDDLRKLKDALQPLKALKKKPLSPKTWANIWLSYRYGLRLTILDTLEIIKVFQSRHDLDRDYGTARAVSPEIPLEIAGKSCSAYYHQKMYYAIESTSFEYGARQLARKFDLWPSLVNIWDLIPYSFVVDWFIPVCDYLEVCDEYIDREIFPCVGVLYSSTIVQNDYTNVTSASLNGQIKYRYYRRWSEDRLPLVSLPSIGVSVVPSNVKHVVDGTALIVQRKR